MHNYANQRDGSFGLWFITDETKGTVLLVCIGMFRRKQRCINASGTNQKNRPFGLWHDAICALTYCDLWGDAFLSGGASHHEAGFHDALLHVVHWVLAL